MDASRYAADAVIRDGRCVHLRAIRPDDRQALLDGFHQLTGQSVYFRFLGAKQELTEAELRRALVEPARRAGYRFEDEELVDEILSDVARERGSLPPVAFAAWTRRRARTSSWIRLVQAKVLPEFMQVPTTAITGTPGNQAPSGSQTASTMRV